jgi:hypothetical protein
MHSRLGKDPEKAKTLFANEKQVSLRIRNLERAKEVETILE